MDNKILFAFNVREKSKPGPKKIVITKEDVVTVRTSSRRFENTIVISPFTVDENYNHVPNYDYTDVNDDYCFINTRVLEPILPNLGKIALRVLWHIIFLLQPNSNCVKFSTYMADQIHGTQKSGATFKEVSKLEQYGLLRRTNHRSVYVVNHNLFFKGNLKEFAEKYKQLYGDKICELTENGYVILDNAGGEEVDKRGIISVTSSLRGVSEDEVRQNQQKFQQGQI